MTESAAVVKPVRDMASWENAIAALKTRAENLDGDVLSAFTPTVFLEPLMVAKNHSLFGRRGTGKTHMFKCLERNLSERFEELRAMPVYIDASELVLEPYGPTHVPQITAVATFGELISATAANIETFLSSRLNPGYWARKFGTGAAKEQESIRSLAVKLKELLSTGEVRYLPIGEASKTAKSLSEAAAEASGAASISLTDPQHVGIKLQASASARRAASSSQVNTVTIEGATNRPI